ncbi:MAG TPA: ComF family protein, partial [Bacillota bacterium]|nr:ComF family protein [Bacillota bacterium]
LTWVPMTRSRLRERGYNPALLLAEALSAVNGYLLQDTLVKTSQPPDQHDLNREQRWQVLEGIYQPYSHLKANGQIYLLVDDVYTTGATLHFCATALKQAGAKDVFCLTAGLTL